MPDKTDYTGGRGIVLLSFPLELLPDEKDYSRVGVHMPAGTIPCGVVPVDDGYHVLAVCEASVQPRVWHPIQMAIADRVIMPTVGRRFGPPIEVLKMHHGAPVAFLPDLPWPRPVEASGDGQ